MNPVDLIKTRIQYLPKRDVQYAEKFIKSRDFEALRELVNSDVYLAEKNANLSNPNPKYKDLNIEELNSLKGLVDEYCNLICPDSAISFGDFEDEDNLEIEGEEW